MSRIQIIALTMVVLAEFVRGGREAFHEIGVFIDEYRRNPARFWRHLHRAALCMMLCTLALAPAAFYFDELAGAVMTT